VSGILATVGRELRGYFLSPLGWVVAALFLFYQGVSFQIILDYLSDPRAPASMQPFAFLFGGTLFFWLLLLFIAAVLTMRLIAEERRTGTLEMLLTAPITEGQVVAGKFLAAFLFYLFLWAPTLLYPVLVSRQVKVDWGPIAAGYVGAAGIGALLLAVGVFASSLARNQVVAAILSFTFCFVFFVPAFLESLVNDPKLRDALQYVNLYQHMDDFGRGIVDSRHLVYYVSATVLFLFLASRALEAAKGK
jgi:ABC-2 type transport system permease protein